MAEVDIPMVLITEILSRLPVKSLIRFRCVSKPWESLTRDPHFINLHLKHSLQNHTNRALIMRDSYMYSLDFPSLNEVTLINHPLKSDGCGTELFGSCNGLLCLSNGDEEGMYGTIFYNPATREHYEIPATPIKFPERGGICDHMVYGFGYDHVNDDYKLMRIVQFFERVESDVQVYSLKSGCWECTCEFPREYHLTYRRAWGFHVNGCLHWVVNRKPKSDGTKSIIAFDLVSREYKIVSQPEYSDDGEFHMNLGVLNGCLYVMCNYVGVKSDIWIMKEYGVHNSWTKLISIVQGGVLGLFEYVRPLACSNDGSRVLAEQEGKRLFWFDLEGQTVENVKVSGLPSLLDSEMMVESLVPLECHNKNRKQKLKIKKEQPKRKKNKSQRRRVRDSDMDAFLDKGFKLKL